MSSIHTRYASRKIKTALIALAILTLLAAGLNWLIGQPPPSASPPWLQTAKIIRGPLEVTVSCSGSLQAMGTVEVGTEVSGTIRTVLVDYNDQVKKGQILAELDLDLFNAEVAKARAETLRAKAMVRQAEAEYRRNQPLLEEGHLSAQEFLDYETGLATARADLMSAKAALRKAETNLRNARIRSPINGTVIEREIEKGQTVAASFNTPTLFILAEDLERMEIEADVDESDIGQIRRGQKVRFTVQAYPDESFPGSVAQIRLNPTEESNVVTYTVVIEAANERGLLLPGMTATIDFIIDAVENVLQVPNAALQYAGKRGSASLLLIEGEGPPRRVSVATGLSDGTRTVVESAELREGLVVVTGEKSEKRKNNGNLFSKLMPRPPHRGPR
ncbi:MAG: efflux RND transporter periplasmic adaptor subunit [Syntrophotaleaceae bacterium]